MRFFLVRRKIAAEKPARCDDSAQSSGSEGEYCGVVADGSAQKAADIIKTVQSLVEKLRIASKTPRGACFINLSNHPSANWDEGQTHAALVHVHVRAHLRLCRTGPYEKPLK